MNKLNKKDVLLEKGINYKLYHIKPSKDFDKILQKVVKKNVNHCRKHMDTKDIDSNHPFINLFKKIKLIK